MSFETLRFIHAANLSLDAPLLPTNSFSETTLKLTTPKLTKAIQQIVEDATLIAFQQIIDCCIEQNVDFLLLTGNSFTESQQSLRAQIALEQNFERLQKKNIRVFILPGMTDPPNAWKSLPRQSSNVTIFYTPTDEPVAVLRDKRVIASITAGPLKRFLQTEQTNFIDSQPHQTAHTHWEIALTTLPEHNEQNEQLNLSTISSHINYLAIGSHHTQQQFSTTSRNAHFPGHSQPLSANQTGPHGCTLITMQANQPLTMQCFATAPIRWEQKKIRITEEISQEQLLKKLQAKLKSQPPRNTEKVRFINWIIHAPASLCKPLQNTEQQQNFAKRIEQNLFPNSKPHDVKPHDAKPQYVMTFHFPENNVRNNTAFPKLAAIYTDELKTSPIDFPEFLDACRQEISTIDQPLLHNAIATAKQSTIMQTAQSFGQQHFGSHTAEQSSIEK